MSKRSNTVIKNKSEPLSVLFSFSSEVLFVHTIRIIGWKCTSQTNSPWTTGDRRQSASIVPFLAKVDSTNSASSEAPDVPAAALVE